DMPAVSVPGRDLGGGQRRHTSMMEGLSTEARIGEILLAIGIVLSFIALVHLILYGALPFTTRFFPTHLIAGYLHAVALVKCAGILTAITGLFSARRRRFQKAGILAVIATLLPPLDIVFFLAGLLLLASPEGRKLS
ncbi:MAG: hypothetical protein WC072_06525, partial [Methanoregulaceae archaeon]